MDRRIGVHSLLLITVLSFAGVPLAIASVSFPASSVLEESAAIRQTNPKSLWDWLFGKKKKSGGSRTPFCSLWPHKDDQDLFEIWSDKPVFVWKVAKGVTSAKRLEVRLPDSESTVWSHDLTANEPDIHTKLHSVVVSDAETRGHPDTGKPPLHSPRLVLRLIATWYQSFPDKSLVTLEPSQEWVIHKVQYNDSPPLNPGQEYEYLVTYERIDENPDGQVIPVTDRQIIPFKVVDAQKRFSIQTELEALERQNSTMTPEELTLQKAHYFAEQGLWSDVIQEIFSVKTPSSELSDVINKIRNQNSCEIKN